VNIGPVARNDGTAEFFDATARGAFPLRRCTFGHLSRPQVRLCSVCGSTNLGWQDASGRAALKSWAVIPGDPPVVPIVAEFEEGPWWWSALVDADLDRLADGLPLRIEFVRPEGSEAVPVFVIDEDAL
jgi:uncharacterized OB-fold protein